MPDHAADGTHRDPACQNYSLASRMCENCGAAVAAQATHRWAILGWVQRQFRSWSAALRFLVVIVALLAASLLWLALLPADLIIGPVHILVRHP